MADAPHIASDQPVLVRLPWPAALVTELPPADNLPSSVAMSYFVKGRPQRGTFVAQKAKALGVSPGPNYGILASGQSVTLDDGRVVQPNEVMGPILPGYGMAVLDVPDVQYLPDLLHKLNALRNANVLTHVHAFLWTLGPNILHSQAFSDFTAQFSSVKHVISAPETSVNHLTMDAFAASAARLAQIRPETFTIPKHDNSFTTSSLPRSDFLQAQRSLTLQVAPKFEVSNLDVPKYLDIDEVIEHMAPETKALIPTGTNVALSSPEKYSDISIATLGTGSAAPSKYRNVSANILHIPALGYFMFDAGENTLGQLRRLYTPAEVDDILCNLHFIWISHLHADHHLGTIPILVAQRQAMGKRESAGYRANHKTYLISERNMADYLGDYASVEDSDIVPLHCLNSQITDRSEKPVKLEDTTMPVSKLDTTRVSHCHGAQAISVTFSNGFKLSYSGDCRPSAAFAEIGHESDVLLHEATFDDGLEGDAMAKKHCTIGEALGVATAMKAKNVILTHFSQRYQKLPTLTDVKFPDQIKFEEGDDTTDAAGPLEEVDEINGNSVVLSKHVSQSTDQSMPPFDANNRQLPVPKKQTSLQEAAQQMSICIAFDLMRVKIPQIKDMYKYYPAIESMFDFEQSKSDEKRGEKRAAQEAFLKFRAKKIEEKMKLGGGSKKGEKLSTKEHAQTSSNEQTKHALAYKQGPFQASGSKKDVVEDPSTNRSHRRKQPRAATPINTNPKRLKKPRLETEGS